MLKVCAYSGCQREFSARRRRTKYCSNKCGYKGQIGRPGTRGSFKLGRKSWLEGKKGVMISPETQFKNGHKVNTPPVGEIRLRGRNKCRYPRRFIKLGKRNWKLLSVYLWEKHYGLVPEGHIVWFKDGDCFNDQDIENLVLLTRSECMRKIKADVNKKVNDNGLNDQDEVNDEEIDWKQYMGHKMFIG